MSSSYPLQATNTLMKTKFIANIVSIPLVILLSGCSPFSMLSNSYDIVSATWQGRGISQTTLDLAIMSKIKFSLLGTGLKVYNMVNYYTFEKRVLVWGNVETKEQKDKILAKIKEVPKVSEVLDCISVGNNDTFLSATNDKWINGKAILCLAGAKHIKSRNYKLMTHEGNIYVMGIASNTEELAYALNMLSYIKGVRKVVSFVRIPSIDHNSTDTL